MGKPIFAFEERIEMVGKIGEINVEYVVGLDMGIVFPCKRKVFFFLDEEGYL